MVILALKVAGIVGFGPAAELPVQQGYCFSPIDSVARVADTLKHSANQACPDVGCLLARRNGGRALGHSSIGCLGGHGV